MTQAQSNEAPLAMLASHVIARKAAILRQWQAAVDRDPELTTASSLPRTQFNDHIPDILDDFARRLFAMPGRESAASRTAQKEDAAAHGLQRWQQGYDLREVAREWGHLQLCLVDELESFAADRPSVAPGVMASARRALVELCNRGISESTAKYFQLRQDEAIGNARDLEHALDQVRELEQSRAALWQQAAHDLRGNLGIVSNATAGLTMDGVPGAVRDKFFRLLQKSVSSLHAMLDDVTDLAHLQAGQEHRDVKPFDAAAVLNELCENLQPMASERGLFLKMDGPASLCVNGDAVKTRRIAQNLLLNALKYTSQGGVLVRWGESRQNDSARWMLTVEDTGPGIHSGSGAPLADALEAATEESAHVEQEARRADGTPDADQPARIAEARRNAGPVHPERGEGIGLSIVKRLCELLDASVEMESEAGAGTTVRVLLPRSYTA